jgi:hypothetical protein
MKAKRRQISVRKPNLANPTVLPNAPYPREKDFAEELTAIIVANTTTTAPRGKQAPAEAGVPENLEAVVSIANNFWRAKKRMLDTASGEIREDMKRIYRDVEAIRRSFSGVGILIRYHRDDDFDEREPKVRIMIRDHTGDAYDEGQPMKVVANKPTPGLDKKRVSETLLPSIFWNNQLVQNGEIEIATPASPNTPTESQPFQP